MRIISPLRLLLALTSLGLLCRASAQTLFIDDFESDSSSRYDLRTGYYEGSATNDFTIDWSFDYGLQTYNFFASRTADPEPRAVPPAPSSAPGTTRGVRISVNKLDALLERFAVNLYPKTTNFSGDYILKFDAFLNHAGYGNSSPDTTEHLLFGLNHSGNKVNWAVLTGSDIAASFANQAVGRESSDGVWFQFVGDDGALHGFQAYQGNSDGPSAFLDGPAGGLLDRDGNGLGDDNGGEPYIASAFTAPPFEAPGVLGKKWVQVEVSQIGNVLTWTIDGKVIARRVNTSAWTSGRVMLGYADTFPGIAEKRDESWVLLDNVRVEQIRTVTVDTADNTSTPGDGKTSLLEALNGLQDNDRIQFNIPGAGPHYLVTPAAGYPLIASHNVVIDGYSQPGSAKNTNGIAGANSARIQIVLDSRAGGRHELSAFGDNGFGDSESAILPVYNARNFTLSGVSVLSATGGDSAEDPFIYGVALIRGATEARIQGNWFGVDPANPTAAGVRGGRAAVASFKWDNDTTAYGLIVGTDSDGFGDVAEHNVITGQLLAIHLETPYVRISGNLINYLPDGTVFDYSQVDGYLPSGLDYESFENGRGHYNTIGTNGDGVNDANERNFFGPVKYDVYAEFWRTATGVTIAGNYFGFGPGGTVVYTNAAPTAVTVIRSFSTLRVGTDYSGPAASDALEANHIAGLGDPIIRFHGSNANADQPARVSFRGNVLSGNIGNAPIDGASGLTAEKFYGLALSNPGGDYVPLISTNSTTNTLVLNVPVRNTSNVGEPISLELYLADPAGLAFTNPPGGSVQGLVFIQHVELDGTFDGGSVDIDISTNGISTLDLRRVTVSASYRLDAAPATDTTVAVPAAYVTTPFSATLGGFLVPTVPIRAFVTRANEGIGLSWTNGVGPFLVQFSPAINGTWQELLTTGTPSVQIPATNTTGFFRIFGN